MRIIKGVRDKQASEQVSRDGGVGFDEIAAIAFS